MATIAIKVNKNGRFASCNCIYKSKYFAINPLMNEDFTGIVDSNFCYTITLIKTGLRIGRFNSVLNAKNTIHKLENCGKVNWEKKSGEYTKLDDITVKGIVYKNGGIMS